MLKKTFHFFHRREEDEAVLGDIFLSFCFFSQINCKYEIGKDMVQKLFF